MKRLVLLLLGGLLAPLLAAAQCTGSYVGNPFINQDPFAPIQRYLARTVIMNGLAEEMMPAESPYNGTPGGPNYLPLKTGPSWRPSPTIPGQQCYKAADGTTPAYYADSLMCQGYCNLAHCPTDYQKQIKFLAHVNASFIAAAAGPFSHPDWYYSASTSGYLTAAKNLVTDINQAYDCQGLRRPIIQAALYEKIDGTPSNNLFNSGAFMIDTEDINACRALIPPGELATYFTGPDLNQARVNVPYAWAEVANDPSGTGDNHYPDLLKTQGLLWMHFLARTYIDLGYTALHMGQITYMAGIFDAEQIQRDHLLAIKRMRRLYKLLTLLRARAAQRTAIPFILISAEPYAPVLTRTERRIFKFALPRSGGDTLLFDFNLAASRFLTINEYGQANQRALLYNNVVRCAPYNTFDITAGIADLYAAHPECFGNQNRMAALDPCHSMNMLPDGGGISPTGLVYPTHTPYLAYVDHTNTEIPLDELNAPNSDLANRGTWDSDDSGWFTFLEEPCKAAWLGYELTAIRQFTPASGFFQVPGRLPNSQIYGVYKMRRHPAVVTALKKAWTPHDPQITMASGVYCDNSVGKSTPGGGPSNAYPTWTFTVTEPSPSSTYSWHIQRPNGTWEPFRYGSTLSYKPSMNGQYTVGVRQDDFGLSNNDWAHGFGVDPAKTVAAMQQCTVGNERGIGSTKVALTQLSPAQLAQLSGGTGLRAAPKQSLAISVYPVPAQQELVVTVNSPSSEDVVISVLSALGQEVAVGKVSASLSLGQCVRKLDVSSLPAGFYLVQVTQGQDRKTTRFVK